MSQVTLPKNLPQYQFARDNLDFLILLLESKRSREATSQSAHALRRGCASSLVCAFLQTEGPERRQPVCNTSARKLCIIKGGGVAEWLNAAVLKNKIAT